MTIVLMWLKVKKLNGCWQKLIRECQLSKKIERLKARIGPSASLITVNFACSPTKLIDDYEKIVSLNR